MIKRLSLILFVLLFPCISYSSSIIFSDNFDDGTISDWTLLNVTASTDVARSGAYSAKAIHDNTVGFRHSFTESTEFYAEWWWYTASTWSDTHPNNGVKFLRINYGNPVGVNVWWNDGSWGTQWSTFDYASVLECDGSNVNTAYFSGKPPVLGGWIKIAVYAKANTAGNNDGAFKIWIGEEDEDFNPNTETPAYNCNTWNWANDGSATFALIDVISNIEDASADSINYVDDIEVWDGIPINNISTIVGVTISGGSF